ncbi:MAG TPA: SURF1 family cytochrome oxidase biogenesis protein, partial [Burkholderiaceae bacterium]|nr:SURF1 family cytochrome oxidase biogenesis protein [Burkholderiaceae bacterium]
RTRIPGLPVPGTVVELTGIAQQDLAQVLELKRLPPPEPSQRIWQNLSLAGYADWSGLRLQPLLLRQTEPVRLVGSAGVPFDDGLVRDWPQPGLDVDKHRGYAFQWYAMAVATAALWGWFAVWRPLHSRSQRSDDKSGNRAA